LKLAAGDARYCHTIALPTEQQKTFMNLGQDNCGIISIFGESDLFRETAYIVRLDDLVTTCDLIKIDVEGFEPQVLAGAQRLLSEERPALHIEFMGPNFEMAGTTPNALMDSITAHGYVIYARFYQDLVFLPRERANAIRS
jgi:hypothetical protein